MQNDQPSLNYNMTCISTNYHNLCLDKRDIIFEELNACERLLKYSKDYNIDDQIEKKAIESEIAYLKTILDLTP